MKWSTTAASAALIGMALGGATILRGAGDATAAIGSNQPVASEMPATWTEQQRQSYALGMNLGNRLRVNGVEVDPALFRRGLADAQSGGETALTTAEASTSLAALERERRAQQKTAQNARLNRNLEQGQAFLTANQQREGVIDLGNGLQYEVLQAGEGPTPGEDDMVVMNYRGTLIDGTEFDSSLRRRRPATFALNRVIPGLRQALQHMPVGSKWQLFIPPELAYGERGDGRRIGPNATIMFEVELVEIKPGSAAKAVAMDGVSDIKVSFKLDPRLTSGLYMGDRWVSPATYTGTRQVGDEYMIEARAQCLDARGQPMATPPQWKPEDPQKVAVSTGQGGAVKITVKQAGESRLTLASNGFSKDLLIKAKYDGEAMQVDIAQ